mmetsp:Transcript_1932/g.4321  ORF Transcript_1932/g.4321 Transcript_1932/m.4321 type:complete len:223 (+) Transcript_1932:135-803(+)
MGDSGCAVLGGGEAPPMVCTYSRKKHPAASSPIITYMMSLLASARRPISLSFRPLRSNWPLTPRRLALERTIVSRCWRRSPKMLAPTVSVSAMLRWASFSLSVDACIFDCTRCVPASRLARCESLSPSEAPERPKSSRETAVDASRRRVFRADTSLLYDFTRAWSLDFSAGGHPRASSSIDLIRSCASASSLSNCATAALRASPVSLVSEPSLSPSDATRLL